ncbi:hypothetical protein PENSPDRAFT_368369 [Peniophora sp. CONT]|nr:hypothetical protein PENSPDRAFT_368369 [Peniophora sp. CONT]
MRWLPAKVIVMLSFPIRAPIGPEDPLPGICRPTLDSQEAGLKLLADKAWLQLGCQGRGSALSCRSSRYCIRQRPDVNGCNARTHDKRNTYSSLPRRRYHNGHTSAEVPISHHGSLTITRIFRYLTDRTTVYYVMSGFSTTGFNDLGTLCEHDAQLYDRIFLV